jgi:hypothetical protein
VVLEAGKGIRVLSQGRVNPNIKLRIKEHLYTSPLATPVPYSYVQAFCQSTQYKANQVATKLDDAEPETYPRIGVNLPERVC